MNPNPSPPPFTESEMAGIIQRTMNVSCGLDITDPARGAGFELTVPVTGQRFRKILTRYAEHGGPEHWELTAYGRGNGFHYARRRSDDGVERHPDHYLCHCPNADDYRR